MDRKIKIAIISDVMDRRPERAVAPRRLVENLLKQPEFEVTMVHYKKMLDDPLYNKVNEIIIPLLSIPWGKHFFSFVWFCLTTKKRFDIVQWLVPRPYPFFWLFPAKKVVITAHDGYVGIWTFANIIFWFTLSFFNKYLHAVIGVSEYARKEIMKTYHIPASKAFAVYNGIDAGYKPIPEVLVRDMLRKYNVVAHKYFLYVGGLVPHKNVPRLILAYDLLCKEKPDMKEKLVIIGKSSLGSVEIDEVVKKTSFSKDIIFLNHVPHEELPPFYSLATATILVSLSEGFGLPIAEGMACGSPVITSNLSAMPDAAGGAAILVDPHNIEDIMGAMKKIVEDDNLRKELISKGLERAKMFTWDRYAQGNIDVYKKILFSIKTSLADIIDRYTILKLKMEGIDAYLAISEAEKEKPALKEEFKLYTNVLDEFRLNGFEVKNEWIENLYIINSEGRELESNIRRNMHKASSLSMAEIEDIGKNALMMRSLNEKRIAAKNEIMQNQKNATTKTIRPSLAEIIDRYTILKLKIERIGNLSADQILYEKNSLSKELAFYNNAINQFRQMGINVNDEWIARLYNINASIWDLESDIRRGKEDQLGLEEVGKRAIKIREYSLKRDAVKNEIVCKSKSGFKELKIFIK